MNVNRLRAEEVSKPRNSADALRSFIDAAKESLPYQDVVWDEPVWSIGSANVKMRAHLQNGNRLWFTPHYGARVPIEKRVLFEAPFADLVKACIVRRRLDRGMESNTQSLFVRAARYLHEALPFPARRDPTLIARGHFVAGETAAMTREKSSYRASINLQEFAMMLDRHGLCRSPIDFRTSAKRPQDVHYRTSAKFEERTANLPTAAALLALATLANDERLLANPPDRLRMRITELLFVCGFRAGEGLTLPADPLVREFVLEDGALRLDARTGEPVERIGLRYTPEKGGEPIVKWVPTEANSLILRSISDIEDICGAFRTNARWLEEHPGDVCADVRDDEMLSMSRAAGFGER